MTPYLEDADFTLYCGDSLTVLRTLPKTSVHMCVTSPPYFGLRDYGTSSWEGGDPDCDHSRPVAPRRDAAGGQFLETRGEQQTRAGLSTQPYRETCGKCGATRVDRQIGLESTPEDYVARMVEVFREVRRVLRGDGTLWLNIGDSYAGHAQTQVVDGKRIPTPRAGSDGASGLQAHLEGTAVRPGCPPGFKSKDLVGIPWRLAFALQTDGWYLRADIIWSKPNPMPESVTDRPTKAHEMVFLLTKSARYYYDAEAIRERFTVAGVVQGTDLAGEGRVFVDDLRFEEATPVAEIGVRLAATILNSAHPEDDLSLPPLDSQVGQKDRDNAASDLIPRVPVERWATAQAARFARGDVPAKEFLGEMHRFWIALTDGDQLKEAWRFAFAHAVLIDANGDRPVGIHDASEVCQFESVHDEQYTSGVTPSRGPSGRNARSVWTIATQPYPEAHFATYPEELVRRCILAGTSERGCCPKCGKPWERVAGALVKPTATFGWRPGCGCGGDGVRGTEGDEFIPPDSLPLAPAVVLDPFLGSGTTALVARKHGRKCIGVELSEPYCAMAAKRLSQLSLLADTTTEPRL